MYPIMLLVVISFLIGGGITLYRKGNRFEWIERSIWTLIVLSVLAVIAAIMKVVLFILF